MSYKAKPRFTKPAQIIISEERRDILPLFNKLGIHIERPSKTDEKKGKE